MADLSDEELTSIMANLGGASYAMAAELQRRRAEQAAGREHVERVVREAIDESRHMPHGQAERAIARRVADRLSAPVLSAEECDALRSIRDQQNAALTSIGHLGNDLAKSLRDRIVLLDRLIAGAKP